jgi:hypothetical protein
LLGKHGSLVLQEFLQSILVQERHRRALNLAFVVFEMNQRLANEANFQLRILHLPDLAGLEWLQNSFILPDSILHLGGLYQNFRGTKSYFFS